jgi:hypothetical protein
MNLNPHTATPRDIVDALSDVAADKINAICPTATPAQFEAMHGALFERLFLTYLARLDALDPVAGATFRVRYLAQTREATGE